MLEIQNVTKVFFPGTVNEKVALENINLHVEKGDVVCVIGSNGSGKLFCLGFVSTSLLAWHVSAHGCGHIFRTMY